MKGTLLQMVLRLGMVAGFLCAPGSAGATLGLGIGSIAQDRVALSAVSRATTRHAAHAVHEIGSDATTVREFVTPSGTVFAIAWNGLVHPDLSVLLGSYHGDYQSAKARARRRHGQRFRQVQGNLVIVETWGHMRNSQGRAYVQDLIPSGVDLNEIR
jgi:hypothetical protein